MTASTAAGTSERALTTGGIWKGALLGAAAGAFGNVLLYVAASAGGVAMVAEWQRGAAATSMPLAPVVISSFVPAIFAALATMVMNRFSSRADKILLVVAIVFGLVSMGGPFTIPQAGVGLRVVLALMHVISGVTITGGILRLGKA